jgi:NADH-dependent peroxiredoxin subunit F
MLDFRLPSSDLTPPAASRLLIPSESEFYDVAILGAGPAGMSAAVYALRKSLKTLLITETIGGQVLWTSGIENYVGFQYITGPELAAKFEAQIRQFPLALARPATVASLKTSAEGFSVATGDSKTYRSKAVIVATGKSPQRLNVPGEKELTGRGVAYCATCDAPLYADGRVAVVGGGNSALTSLIDLIPLARVIYSIHRRDTYRGDRTLVDKVMAAANVRPMMNCEPVRVIGDERVTGIEVRNRTNGQSQRLDVDGVFVEIGSKPNTEFVRGVVETNDRGEIVINCRAETSLPGLYAAGDVTSVFEKQIVIAAGEGAKAALAAHAWLLSHSC